MNSKATVNKGVKNQNAGHWIEMGRMFYDNKRLVKAIKCYNKAIKLDPNNADVFCCLGDALSALAKIRKNEDLFEKAFGQYERSIRLDQNNADVFHSWWVAIFDLYETKRDESLLDSAFERFENVAMTDPSNSLAFIECGKANLELAEIKNKESLFEKACERFEIAARSDPKNASAYYYWVYAKLYRAENNNDVGLFEVAFEKLGVAAELNPKDAFTYNLWGYAKLRLAEIKAGMSNEQKMSLFEEGREKCAIAARLNPNDADAVYNWGKAILRLAEFDKGEDFQKKFKDFESASENIDDPDIHLIRGELCFVLGQTDDAKKWFKESGKYVLDILIFLDEANREKIIETDILHSLLKSDDKAGVFFKKTTENLGPEQKKDIEKYMTVYIYSAYIVSLLHVNDKKENLIAHYREKETAQKLLFDKGSKFRLNAIDYSNDASEGKALLEYIYGEEIRGFNDKINNEEYEAFAACFVFDYDNLNMFRLYGKNEFNEEGTGLSLVFRNSFFRNDPKDISGSQKENKLPLYRCIYIDPSTRSVITVGRKEKYLFYREDPKGNFNDYDNTIKDIIGKVSAKMKDLQDKAKKLEPPVVGQLLLTLRYLVKHVAFKEEQECRIVDIRHLYRDEKVIVGNNYKSMYVEYSPEVSSHIDRICFGPKFKDGELFQAILKRKGLNITCEKSKNPLA